MARYVMTGRPVNAPFTELQDHQIGDIFEAEIDPEIERVLCGSGALQLLSDEPEPKPQSKEKSSDDPGSTGTTAAKPKSAGKSGQSQTEVVEPRSGSDDY